MTVFSTIYLWLIQIFLLENCNMGCNCNDIQHQCSCLEASIKRIPPPLAVCISRVDEIDSLQVGQLGGVMVSIYPGSNKLPFAVCRADEINNVIITPSCGLGTDDVLRFSQNILLWSEKDNYIGSIKYNTLVSSEDWILEEIEELL